MGDTDLLCKHFHDYSETFENDLLKVEDEILKKVGI